MSFTWIPYYKEFAQRLTQFQKDRKRLLNLIYNNRDELLAKYLHDQGGEGDLLEDIDPFTVFGLFNRGIKHENRINSAKLFKNILDIKQGAFKMKNKKQIFRKILKVFRFLIIRSLIFLDLDPIEGKMTYRICGIYL